MKVIVSKHVVLIEKEFILIEDNVSKVDLEEVQETTNKIDPLDEPMIEPTSDEAQIGNGEPLVSEDRPALHKSNRVIHLSWRCDFLIIKDELLIEEDEPTTYAKSKIVLTQRSGRKPWNPK
ncbi:Uncharacterized protein Adt_39526 [Abeliophyllum distichum]|uniref:Uncharacterized protein n=1 Tax=Abeliophyllum distichum TaxID=126358 RepID=A0ABD1Q5B4_9LAMI